MAVAGVWVLRKVPDATLSAQSLRRTTDPDIGDLAITTVLAVSGEELFVVSGATAQPAQRASLAEAGLLERQHLQEWVIANPQLLGADVKIITSEFDRWLTPAGEATWERLDVLGLSRTGRLVMAELKRGRAPDAVMVQALNYAAMVSRFTLDLLVEAYAGTNANGRATPELVAELQEWAPELSDETLSPPQVVLVAEEFGLVLTNTAMYLIEQGVDIRLVRIQLYSLADGPLLLTSSQVLPVPDAEDFMVRPRSGSQTQRATRVAAKRRAAIPYRLVAAGVFADGDELTIVVPAGAAVDRDTISDWLAADPDRARVRWRQDPRQPVVWAVDGQPWNLTTLIDHVVAEATGEVAPIKVWGPNWYQDASGRVLHKIAEPLADPQ
jgi:hypothetical protein